MAAAPSAWQSLPAPKLTTYTAKSAPPPSSKPNPGDTAASAARNPPLCPHTQCAKVQSAQSKWQKESSPFALRVRPPESPAPILLQFPPSAQAASIHRKRALRSRPAPGKPLPSSARHIPQAVSATPTKADTPQGSEPTTPGSSESSIQTPAAASARPFHTPPHDAPAPSREPVAKPAQNLRRSAR